MATMLGTLLLLAASVGLGSAETVMMFGGIDNFGSVVSSIGSDATATTWLMGCLATVNSSDCPLPTPISLTLGPSTAHYTTTQPGVTLHNDCKLAGTTYAACSLSYDGPSLTESEYEGQDMTNANVLTGADAASLWGDVTVVHDAKSILGAVAGTTATADSTSAGGATAISAPGGSTAAPTSTLTGTVSTNTGAVESSQSTGAMPQITGSCGWAVGGAAAAAVLAAL